MCMCGFSRACFVSLRFEGPSACGGLRDAGAVERGGCLGTCGGGVRQLSRSDCRCVDCQLFRGDTQMAMACRHGYLSASFIEKGRERERRLVFSEFACVYRLDEGTVRAKCGSRRGAFLTCLALFFFISPWQARHPLLCFSRGMALHL